jgi:hypothetical protein
MSRTDIFDPATGAPWAKFAVIRPNEPVRLNLAGSLLGSSKDSPAATKALMALFPSLQRQNGGEQRQFASLDALSQDVRGRAGKAMASDFENFLYGSFATKPARLSSGPWSEKGEKAFSRVILRISTAARRTYRSSPGLLAFGPDPAYSVDEGLRQ